MLVSHLSLGATESDLEVRVEKSACSTPWNLSWLRGIFHPIESPNQCLKDWRPFFFLHRDVSENSGTPKSSIFNRVFHYKPSILGYPYFWKHPPRSLHEDDVNSSNIPDTHKIQKTQNKNSGREKKLSCTVSVGRPGEKGVPNKHLPI